MKIIYVKAETHTRIKALAYLDGRTMLEYVDRVMREKVTEHVSSEYNAAVEAVTAEPLIGNGD